MVNRASWATYVSYGLLAMCAIGVLAVTVIAVAPAPATAGEEFTELYVLDASGNAVEYPTRLSPNENTTVVVGVVNREARATDYRVTLGWDDRTVSHRQIHLSRGETWQQPFSVRAPRQSGIHRLEIDLYRADPSPAGDPHRELNLTIRVGVNESDGGPDE